MENHRIFEDDYVRFDTLLARKGDSNASTIEEIFRDAIKPRETVSLGKSSQLLNVFSDLELIKTDDYSSVDKIDLKKIKEFVDRLENFSTYSETKKLNFSSRNENLEKGIGSFSTYLFSKLFLGLFASETLTLRSTDNNIMPAIQYREPAVRGKIRDYIFIADKDFKTGKGHLSVDVVHEFCDSKGDHSVFHHWDIDIHKYTVFKRDDTNFPNLPFPELKDKITFPAFSLDPEDDRSIWKRCLDHKLFAEGKDEKGNDNFTINDIYQRVDGGPLIRLDDAHDWYRVTKESCIDLMFKGYPPASGLPPQSNYCLGRCEHPKIVNTCGD